jgi:5'-methylthioadenosine phosphorylase
MIGIIGGSGLEDPKIMAGAKEVTIKTPYGKHCEIVTGKINGVEVAVLSRHGAKHEYSPSMVPYKANIYALHKLGCTAIIAASACGSLKEEIVPGSFSFPAHFVDRTTKRDQSFTEHGKVIHEPMGNPFDEKLRKILEGECEKLGFDFTAETTVVTIEGPRFSTKAESELFRSWGCDLINMTTVPEACLAKELKMPYQVINLVTDYDCWREGTAHVTIEQVMKIVKENSNNVKKLITAALPKINAKFEKK